MHHSDLSATWVLVNTIANVAIVTGYVLVPFTVLRYLPLTRSVLASGTMFFLTCAITHLSMAFNFIGEEVLVVNHVVQGASVILFVSGFFSLLRKADQLRRVKTDVPPIDADGLT